MVSPSRGAARAWLRVAVERRKLHAEPEALATSLRIARLPT